MPTTPRHEDMRIDPSWNITPEVSLISPPVVVGNIEEERERNSQLLEEDLQGTSSETAIWKCLILI